MVEKSAYNAGKLATEPGHEEENVWTMLRNLGFILNTSKGGIQKSSLIQFISERSLYDDTLYLNKMITKDHYAAVKQIKKLRKSEGKCEGLD